MASYTLHIQYVDRPAETRTFTQAKISFGRDAGDVVLHDSQVSGRHGEITFDGNTLRYTDVGSTNGSFLMQGQRVANIELTAGIALRLGNSLVTVQAIDAPNVALKGRTVIAGPGMAPGFPAPMRPAPAPGPIAVAGAPIPRPPAPQPVAPGAPPPGGFAFAPTAQMQSPMAPPQPVQPVRPAFSAAPPMPGGPPQPAFSPVAPQPVFAQQPAFSPVAPQPVFAQQPAFSPVAPQPVLPQPPGPPPGQAYQPYQPNQPNHAAAPEEDDLATPMPDPPDEQDIAVAPIAIPEVHDEAPKDLVTAIKQGLLASWAVAQPTLVPAAMVGAAAFVSLNLLFLILLTILPISLWGIIGLLMWVGWLAAAAIVLPSVMRMVLGSYLGAPMGPKEAVQETVAKIADRGVNCAIPMYILGVFAGPIYYVENKKVGDVISRNFALLGKDWVTALVCVLAVFVGVNVVSYVLGMILAYIPGGAWLAAIVSGAIAGVLVTLLAAVSVYFYFSYRRRFEGGDPEAEGRAALAGVASLPQ